MAATAAARRKSNPHPLLTSFRSRCGIQIRDNEIARKPSRQPPSDRRSSLPAGHLAGDPERDGGLEELRAKLLGHLRDAADRMKLAGEKLAGEKPPPETPSSSSARPWNLRSRKSACKVATVTPSPPPPPPLDSRERTVRLTSEDGERREFSIAISREEMKEDIFAFTGSAPRRRPKKRAKIVQKQLDSLFPGLWLTEVTPELYKVDD